MDLPYTIFGYIQSGRESVCRVTISVGIPIGLDIGSGASRFISFSTGLVIMRTPLQAVLNTLIYFVSVEDFELQNVYVSTMPRDSSSSKLIPKIAEKEEESELSDRDPDFYISESEKKNDQQEDIEDFKFEEVFHYFAI